MNHEKLTAGKLYEAYFSLKSLTSLYYDKISLSKAVGRDGVRGGKFESQLSDEIDIIRRKVADQSYEFTGFKERLISKGAHKPPRQISIPTFRDRLTLRALCEIISEVFSDASSSPPHEYIKNIRNILKDVNNDYCFLRIDIKDYYPTINQEILLQKIRRRIKKVELINLINKAIKTPTGKKNVEKNQVSSGVPQGLSISNILSSIYLLSLDAKYQSQSDFYYFRYVDDILVICPKALATSIYKKIYLDLSSLNLEPHDLRYGKSGKTEISDIKQGVEYLGFKISKSELSVRSSSYNRMFSNILKVFTSYKYSRDKNRLLFRLNLKITGCIFDDKRRGWLFFFAQSENLHQLKYLDKFVSNLVDKYNLSSIKKDIKTFTKAYHEIRYKADRTKYIENFTKYSQSQKIKLIELLTKKTEEEIQTWNVDKIDFEFRQLAFKEVALLEKDLIEAWS